MNAFDLSKYFSFCIQLKIKQKIKFEFISDLKLRNPSWNNYASNNFSYLLLYKSSLKNINSQLKKHIKKKFDFYIKYAIFFFIIIKLIKIFYVFKNTYQET